MSLDTGKRIHRYQWAVLPLNKDTLRRVKIIADYQQQLLLASNSTYKLNSKGKEMIDGDDISDNGDLEIWEELPPPLAMLAIEQENEYTK